MNTTKALIVVCALGALAATTMATPLDLQDVKLFPDINSSSNVTVDYDADSNMLSVAGDVIQYSPSSGVSATVAEGTYSLSAEVDDTGALLDGTLTIHGKVGFFDGSTMNWVAGSATTTEDILVADLTDIGFTESGASLHILEFLSDGGVTGGALAGAFGGKVGTIIAPAGDFDGAWDQDFTGGGSGASIDTFAVPEPATLALLVGGFVTAALRRRRA